MWRYWSKGSGLEWDASGNTKWDQIEREVHVLEMALSRKNVLEMGRVYCGGQIIISGMFWREPNQFYRPSSISTNKHICRVWPHLLVLTMRVLPTSFRLWSIFWIPFPVLAYSIRGHLVTKLTFSLPCLHNSTWSHIRGSLANPLKTGLKSMKLVLRI
jgi:hypothetical protein